MTLAAAWAHGQAWKARGEGTADIVSDSARDTWTQWNKTAISLMQEADRRANHTDPLVFYSADGAFTILGEEERATMNNHILSIDPWCERIWFSMIEYGDFRWTGSWKNLPNIVSHIAHNAPEGHPVLSLVPLAIDGQNLTLCLFGELPPDDAMDKTWRNPELLEAFQLAYSKFKVNTQDSPRRLLLWERFAFGATRAKLAAEAVEAMSVTQGEFGGLWSGWLHTPAEYYREKRDHMIRTAYRRARPLPEDATLDWDWGSKGAPVL